MSNTVDMTVGNPTKHILKFAFPLIITNLGQQLYMVADAAIVGRGVGVKALAAVGATDWVNLMFIWIALGFTQAFSSFISRYFGEKNYNRMNKTIAMSTLLCIAIGIILTVSGIFTAKPLLEILKTPDDIKQGAVTYLMIMTGGSLIVTAYNMASAILRAFGNGRAPLIAMLISAILNVGLDCLFVLVFGWGIVGAAVASLCAQLFSFLYCLIMIRRITIIKLTKESWKIDFKLIKELILFGIPLVMQFISIALGGIILQSSVNTEGSIFVGAYTATNKVYALLESTAISIGIACSTYLAQNYGAKEIKRFKKGVITGELIVIILAVAVMIITFILREPIMKLFVDVNESGGFEALKISIHYLNILIICLTILYSIHIYRNALVAMGISFWPMISGISECVCRVVMGKFAIHTFLGSDALFYAEPISWIAALLFVMIPYFFYKRKLLK
ncbi:MAG: MATE family efflux transporter [Clostridia bacterium]|nr:MATE family efflux transporter [Clostridia bacterium]